MYPNVAIDILIFTFYSDQIVIDVETGIVNNYFLYNIVDIIIILYACDHGMKGV
jgi:hypothetical protein